MACVSAGGKKKVVCEPGFEFGVSFSLLEWVLRQIEEFVSGGGKRSPTPFLGYREKGKSMGWLENATHMRLWHPRYETAPVSPT